MSAIAAIVSLTESAKLNDKAQLRGHSSRYSYSPTAPVKPKAVKIPFEEVGNFLGWNYPFARFLRAVMKELMEKAR